MSEDPTYPEARPSFDPSVRFWFDPNRAEDTDHDLDLRLEASDARLDALISKCEINGMPVLGMILKVTHNVDDLARLAKGLERVCTVLPEYDRLQRRKAVLDAIRQEPEWFYANFSDPEHDLDNLPGLLEDWKATS
jgi:hypothetical protein